MRGHFSFYDSFVCGSDKVTTSGHDSTVGGSVVARERHDVTTHRNRHGVEALTRVNDFWSSVSPFWWRGWRISAKPWFLAGCCQPSLRDDVIHKHGALVLFLGPVEFTVLGPQKAADMALGDVEDSEVAGNSLCDNKAPSKLRGKDINCIIKILNLLLIHNTWTWLEILWILNLLCNKISGMGDYRILLTLYTCICKSWVKLFKEALELGPLWLTEWKCCILWVFFSLGRS